MNSGASVAAAGSRRGRHLGGDDPRPSTDVYAAFSRDGGASFGAPARVNDVDGDARVSGEQAPRVALGDGRRGRLGLAAGGARPSFAPRRPARARSTLRARHDGPRRQPDGRARMGVPGRRPRRRRSTSPGWTGGSRPPTAGPLPGRVAAGRNARRGPGGDGRLLLLQDRGRDGPGRRRLRRLAAHLPSQPARHGGGAIDRRGPDLRGAGARQRGRLGDRRLSRRRAFDRRGHRGDRAHRVADDGPGKRAGKAVFYSYSAGRRAHVRAARAPGRRGGAAAHPQVAVGGDRVVRRVGPGHGPPARVRTGDLERPEGRRVDAPRSARSRS